MIKYLLNFIFVFSIVTFTSCNSDSENSVTYFGGKIINPKSNHVVLFSMDKVIDTFFLNDHNKFIGELSNATEGLYYFKHGVENQYIYLEPQDSLMLRLNTWDFDESLVFAGKGAERNNILIDCFLEDEKDNKMFYKLNKLSPDHFQHKMESLLKLKLNTYKDYIENHPEETSAYNSILKVALTYPIYSRIERYPIAHVKHSNTKDFPTTKESFYNHRKHVNINKDSLMYYYPYSKYISNYLYNMTYSLGHKPMVDEYSSKFTIDLLNTINDKIKTPVYKNALLKQTVIQHFYKKSSCDINENAFREYFELSSNNIDKQHVKQLLRDSKSLMKGNKIMDFVVSDFNNTKHQIKDIIKGKNTFLFFWNPEYVSPMYISTRMNYFSNKFPEIQFIQIKIDGTDKDKIHKLDIKNQYFIDTESKANNFLASKMPRSIIINKKGIVTNGYASISSKKVYSQLKELTKN